MDIEQYIYGMTPEGDAVVVYTMTAANGAQVEVCNLGATLLSVRVPDRNGKIEDVALGYSDLENLMRDSAFVGRSVGRVANRIAQGRMTIEGTEYRLGINNGQNHLHGGNKGFATKLWEARTETNRVVMTLHSEASDEGYPSAVDVECVFDFDDENSLELTYRAVSDGTTVVNLTNHAYFNLSGGAEPTIFDHELKLCSTKVLEMNEYQIPTGEALDIEGTSMDFTSPKRLGDAIEGDFNRTQEFRGLDHFFEKEGYEPSILSPVALLSDPQSGRSMRVLTSASGCMVYTGNWLASGSPISKSGVPLVDYQGVAIECQTHPNAINTPHFPSIELRAGEIYCNKIVFQFQTF